MDDEETKDYLDELLTEGTAEANNVEEVFMTFVGLTNLVAEVNAQQDEKTFVLVTSFDIKEMDENGNLVDPEEDIPVGDLDNVTDFPTKH